MHHVAAEAVDAFGGPEAQYVQHFQPGVGRRVEVPGVVAGVPAVVQLHGVVPVVFSRKSGEAVVARCFCGEFHVCAGAAAHVDVRGELLAGDVVEIVVAGEEHVLVVAGAEIVDSGRPGIGAVLAGHMVGHEVYYHSHACGVCARYERFEFVHAAWNVDCQVGVDVVVVGDGIGAAGFAFHYVAVVRSDAVFAVVGAVCVFNHPCVPHVRGSQFADFTQHMGVYVVELSGAVPLHGAAGNRVGAAVGK